MLPIVEPNVRTFPVLYEEPSFHSLERDGPPRRLFAAERFGPRLENSQNIHFAVTLAQCQRRYHLYSKKKDFVNADSHFLGNSLHSEAWTSRGPKHHAT